MTDLLVASRRLVTYMGDNEVIITNDSSRSKTAMLAALTAELKEAVNNNQPMSAQHLIRRCFTQPIATAIQTTRP